MSQVKPTLSQPSLSPAELHALLEEERQQSGIVFDPRSPELRVAYLGPADKYFGPLPTRLRSVNQPVIRTRNGFSAPHPTQLACI